MRLPRHQQDRLTAIVLMALGIGMLVGGYSMDRLEIRQIHPASIPGLVPMVLGASLALCAALLFAGSRHQDLPPVTRPRDDTAAQHGPSVARLLLAGGWSLIYALLMVGRLPFALATGIYISVFVILFSLSAATTLAARARLVLFAVIFGSLMATAIAALFRYGFLVRLP